MQVETQGVTKPAGKCEAYGIHVQGTVNGAYSKMSQSANIVRKMKPNQSLDHAYQCAHYVTLSASILGDGIQNDRLCLGRLRYGFIGLPS